MKILIILLLSCWLSAFYTAQLEKDNRAFLEAYEEDIVDDFTIYKTKVFYEVNYEAKELLQRAELSKKTYFLLLKAFDMHSKMQNGMFAILSTIEKKQYMREHKIYIEALFSATFKSSDIKETFNRWINYKRTLFDRENLVFLDKSMHAKKTILEKRKRALAREYQRSSLHQKEIDVLNKDIVEFEKSLSYDIAQKIKSRVIDYQELFSVLKSNELYIDFAKIGDFYYIFTLDSQQKIGFKKLDAFRIDTLIQEIQQERESIIEGSTFANIEKSKKEYGKLYRLIFNQIDIQNKDTLIISPDGLLTLTPFEAFYSEREKKYLIEKLNISYVPSAKELIKLHYKHFNANKKIVVFANPNFEYTSSRRDSRGKNFRLLTSTFSRLDGTLIEAKKIQETLLNVTLFQGKMATEENLFGVYSPEVLHLATHGFLLKSEEILNPMLKSGIVLSGANYAIKNRTGEGIITALELSGLNLENTELVVLSACETGVGEIEEAEGVAGINRAFMQAGARYIVMTLWSVSDRATATLMESFYQNIRDKKSYGEALREAKIEMIKNGNSHPYYWSGFVGSGVY